MDRIVSVVGWHNAGKTTVVEGLVKELKGRGLRVATIKHTREEIRLDTPGTDTWRFAQAGSDLVIIAGAEGTYSWERRDTEEDLETLLTRVPADVDLVIAEGYKQANTPKIEVRRKETGAEPVRGNGPLLAVVTDAKDAGEATPVYSFEELPALVDMLVKSGLVADSLRVSKART